MKNIKLKLAVLGAFGMLSAQAMATGLVALPTAGFAVTGGTSAYTLCNTTGGFGAGVAADPTATTNNTCAVFPANSLTSPVAGFTLVAGTDTTQTVQANGQNLYYMDQRVFRNTAKTECIFTKRIRMYTTGTFDYNPGLAGSQRLEVNDVAVAGYSATPTVQAGYYLSATSDSPIYRIGRAFTSVQYKNDQSNAAFPPLSGFLQQPLVSPAPVASTDINGPTNPVGGEATSATAAQQTAAIRTNWVDFTLDITGGLDEDDNGNPVPGSSEPNSPWMYVRGSCTAAAPIAVANSVKLRQTGQESQPFVSVSGPGYARAGANANF